MKRKTAAVLAICIALTLLSCKGDDTPVEPTPPEATPTHVPTATPMVAPDDEDPYIIAILTDMPKDEPETTAILRAKELYQDRIAWYLAARDQDDALKRMYYDWDIFVGNALHHPGFHHHLIGWDIILIASAVQAFQHNGFKGIF